MAISVVFAGSAAFGVKSLHALLSDDRFKVEAVICNEAKPVGRKQVLTLPPLGQAAVDFDLPVY
ncbi:methionyl-tRNA formyltransferase, partial [Candidatus Peregrinibacteria bacterium CG_4_10_14_0_2_um_filter_41_8]